MEFPLSFHIGSEPKIVFAFWLGVAVVAVTLLMLLIIIVMRQVVSYRERVHLSAVARWSGLLATASPDALPALPRREVGGFIAAWVTRAARGDEPVSRLRQSAAAVGLEAHLVRLLDRGDFNDRVAAISALGHYGDVAHFERLARFLGDRSPIVSLCAAGAVMRLDPPRAVQMIVPQITRREDWSRGRVAAILRDARHDSVAQALSEATLRANADLAPRLVRFLAGIDSVQASAVIRTCLRTTDDDHLVSTCLQVLSDAADLDLVRPLLTHPQWHVRMHAASALGRLGQRGDEAHLIRLLSDSQWWVRYRAAQALTQLPFLDEAALYAIGSAQTDRYAVDILGQVMAEKKMGILA
ncbi:MAG TPA: HEAT repeat domain-containing protein [Lysobacter sp.]